MLRGALCFSLICLIASPLMAAPELPQNPAQWVNFVPVSLESLKGKGVVLYFYEEGCPNCAKRWPELIEVSKKYENQPVVFMAVNSGTNRNAVMSYARENNVIWPMIVDADRSLEKECNVPEVSLKNIIQVRVVKPDGSIVMGSSNLERSAELALQGAAWKLDPTGMPPELKPAWMALELGEYAKAAAGIKKGISAKDETTKAVAEKMQATINSLLSGGLAEAGTLASQGEKWAALKKYEQVAAEFRGFDFPEEAEATRKELLLDETVKAEMQAMKQLEAAKRTGARGSDASVRRAVKQLEQLVETMPETEAAAEAQKIIDQVNAQ
jgi:thiol-disulfide isomerase/thioredoxin